MKLKVKAIFLIVVLLAVIRCIPCSHGLTTEKEISAFVHDNLSVVKNGDTAQILALSEELSVFDSSSNEYAAFICGTSGIGPDGTYYGFYISFDGAAKNMQGCNEYLTAHIVENIYYFEYTVW